MSWFTRLFSSAGRCGQIFGDDLYEFPIVGESFHQDVLLKIVGGRGEKSCRVYHAALLLPEPNNPYDRHAVEVLILGHQVGHLARHTAPKFLRALSASGFSRAAAEAVIVGGWKRRPGEDEDGYFGVKLNATMPFELT